MTESKVFEILLKNKCDFPKLHEEAASSLANSFADIIYDTLKLKSSVPTSRRLNAISFLKNLGSNPENHITVNEQNLSLFIEKCQKHLDTNETEDLIKEGSRELEEKKWEIFSDSVKDFHKRKNEWKRKNMKAMEMMKKNDQEALNRANFPAKVARNISYYETSESLIDNFLQDLKPNQNTPKNSNETDYRKKQIKFAYSLHYLRKFETLKIVLQKLKKYKYLNDAEINFVIYLNDNLDDNVHLADYILENFFFIYEKIMISFCTKILNTENCDLLKYFEQLLQDKNFIKIKELCKNESFRLKLTDLLHELYVCSYCNLKLLHFIKFIF